MVYCSCLKCCVFHTLNQYGWRIFWFSSVFLCVTIGVNWVEFFSPTTKKTSQQSVYQHQGWVWHDDTTKPTIETLLQCFSVTSSSDNLSFRNISIWSSRITFCSVQHINIYRGFWKSLAPACTHQTILPRSRQFVMLWMQVSTVTARISNILLIKSLLVARLANRHSCVTAGAQTAPKCCSWLHPTELIIYQRGAPVLTLSDPPSGRGFFSLPESERKKNLMVNIDLTNTPPPPKKKKIHFKIICTSLCIHCTVNLFWDKAARLFSAAVARHTSSPSPRLA